VLRAPRPGDLGWVVQAHGELYAREYGWGERAGSVFVVPASKRVAKLRLLLVDPRARGRGLGKRLVRECIAFARAQGYRKLVLWTQSNLAAARAIYRDCGFALGKREPHAAFGVKLTGEYWEKLL